MHSPDPLDREELIRSYLLKRLDHRRVEIFESHYLACDECFEELRAAELLMAGLSQIKLHLRRLDDVVLLQFTGPVQLTRDSQDLQAAVMQNVLEQKDTKVLIDLSRVSRIDSAGLGLLMSCYSHAVCNHGMLKLLNPTAEVQKVLHLTHMDAVVETFFDETQALRSFQSSPEALRRGLDGG